MLLEVIEPMLHHHLLSTEKSLNHDDNKHQIIMRNLTNPPRSVVCWAALRMFQLAALSAVLRCSSFQPIARNQPCPVATWQPWSFARTTTPPLLVSFQQSLQQRARESGCNRLGVSTCDPQATVNNANQYPSPSMGWIGTMRNRLSNGIRVCKQSTRVSFRSIRRIIAAIVIAFALTLSTPAAWAVSGGRMGGGSFKGSSGGSMGGGGRTSTLSRPQSSHTMLPPRRTPQYYGTTVRPPSPIIINSYGNRWYAPTHETAIANTRVTAKDIVVMTGAGALLVYGMHNNYKNRYQGDGAMGPGGLLGLGYTVGSLTVALDVPNRSDPENILSKLSRLSTTVDTISRKGVQDMLSEVSLELLRQEKAITSAYAQFNAYPISGQAEREFQVLSVSSQSKVDRLTGTFLVLAPVRFRYPMCSAGQVCFGYLIYLYVPLLLSQLEQSTSLKTNPP
jgi:Protein of unknown function (DUF1517)